MTTRRRIALLAAGAAIASVAVNVCFADMAADVAALKAANDTFIKAYNGNDADGVAALYDEHAVLMPPGIAAQSGREKIKAYYVKDMAQAAKDGVSLSMNPKASAGVSGSWGWTSGTYSVSNKSGKVLETGKYLSVSHKKDGQWLYVRDTWNSDAPTAAAAAPAPPAAPAKK